MKYEVQRKKGFTLLEVLVYITVLAIVMVAISSFLLWAIKVNAKTKVMRETLDNAGRAMEIMVHEIKEAENIYEPTSIFSSHPGQLSLETKKYLPAGETSIYIDFYICDNRLCLKKESQDPVVLTSDSVEINNLTFTRVVTGQMSSVQINLEVDYKDLTDRPEYQAEVILQSVASLRAD